MYKQAVKVGPKFMKGGVYSKSALDGLLNQTYKELTIIYFIMLCLEHVRVLMRTSSSKRHHKNRIYSRIFDSS